jgi:hypothetical protein
MTAARRGELTTAGAPGKLVISPDDQARIKTLADRLLTASANAEAMPVSPITAF